MLPVLDPVGWIGRHIWNLAIDREPHNRQTYYPWAYYTAMNSKKGMMSIICVTRTPQELICWTLLKTIILFIIMCVQIVFSYCTWTDLQVVLHACSWLKAVCCLWDLSGEHHSACHPSDVCHQRAVMSHHLIWLVCTSVPVHMYIGLSGHIHMGSLPSIYPVLEPQMCPM